MPQTRPTKCCGRPSRYDKTCYFYMYSNYIVRIIPAIDIWYFVMGIDYNSSTSIQQYIRDIVHRAFYLQHFRHYDSYYCRNNCSCCCSHIDASRKCVATGQAPITLYSSSSVQYARNAVSLFMDETHTRGAQIRDVTRTYTRYTFGFWRERLYHRPLGVRLF